MARTGPPGMSAQWSLSVGKRTWLGLPISVEIDPTETWWPRKSSKFPPAHGGENLIVDRYSGEG
jgi:hypothetical protein